ncbi:MAG: hypothetical protein ACHQAY_17220 [Hyphomicrobiales bacterium]
MSHWHDILIALLILHGIAAFLLLGALTHQVICVWAPVHARVSNFVGHLRAVAGADYVGAIIVLYIVTFVLGAIVYPDFKITASNVLVEKHFVKSLDSFEFKEHIIAIGLALLPAYWYYWRRPLVPEHARTRAMVTTLLTFIAWWGFITGHVLNNIRGLGV